MTENKFSKYLLYAIGEIVLVVIGILIALQVNLWNNNKKDKEIERKVLVELKGGLEKDRDLLRERKARDSSHYEDLVTLHSLLDNPDHVYTTELDRLFGRVYGIRNVRLNMAFYEDLKSNGLQIIKNEDVRFSIVHLFEDN